MCKICKTLEICNFAKSSSETSARGKSSYFTVKAASVDTTRSKASTSACESKIFLLYACSRACFDIVLEKTEDKARAKNVLMADFHYPLKTLVPGFSLGSYKQASKLTYM